ncbi:AAA domain-containing protein [Streptomyces sp. NPDC045470]|uniref:AAA domain-containing protein n=1 Tax=Streptomyces sp. NPDC045470 TaxID=3155469 RepID=UPI0033E7B401
MTGGVSARGPHETSRCNEAEAVAARGSVTDLLAGLPAEAEIGAVTPFRAHKEVLERMLSRERVRVGTVHAFQGGQRHVMMLSPVVTDNSPQEATHRIASQVNLWNAAIAGPPPRLRRPRSAPHRHPHPSPTRPLPRRLEDRPCRTPRLSHPPHRRPSRRPRPEVLDRSAAPHSHRNACRTPRRSRRGAHHRAGSGAGGMGPRKVTPVGGAVPRALSRTGLWPRSHQGETQTVTGSAGAADERKLPTALVIARQYMHRSPGPATRSSDSLSGTSSSRGRMNHSSAAPPVRRDRCPHADRSPCAPRTNRDPADNRSTSVRQTPVRPGGLNCSPHGRTASATPRPSASLRRP